MSCCIMLNAGAVAITRSFDESRANFEAVYKRSDLRTDPVLSFAFEDLVRKIGADRAAGTYVHRTID